MIMLSLKLSWTSISVQAGDVEVGVEVPPAISEALDGFNPFILTDHSEEKEVTLPVKTGQ